MTVIVVGLVGAGLVLVAVMTLAWLTQRVTGNAGWSDAFWSFGVGLAGVGLALLPVSGLEWPSSRQLLVALAAGLWSVRLGSHIAARSRGSAEDARYAAFRKEWGAAFQRRLFVFLMIQAAAGWFLGLSILAAAQNPREGLGLQDAAAVALILVAILGETLADRRLQRFRERQQAGQGAVCEDGLWAWSRHPNYFFEWLGWLAYPVFAIDFGGYAFGFVALTGPAFMYWLLVHVSGIPPLEAHMMRSRPEAFARYRDRVPAFFPRPPSRKRA
ncbi:Steroid 5-alpha reductase family enzyme [Kaistia soli DSM 19436]|uniref:Steroid 5-alpha reductase family enzyme n=1 Tax=Kaistia soli DSM 19436 TaxID=1122133 RepID=A0A1M5FV61_9HYPH|nr:DUF1295 domain-containing protein [Kaistia soli]SHF95447.1 Steroid 5-alpha reductase family enzyme [Kaistia soli DSM 19436]